MDLLGDLGNQDQLTSAREENKVLQARVKELTAKVKVLNVENAALLAEVEMYRKEKATSGLCHSNSGRDVYNDNDSRYASSGEVVDEFMTSGDGIFPTEVIASLPLTDGASNPLCCALHCKNDSLLASGCANGSLILCPWGSATAPHESAVNDCLQKQTARIPLGSPIICTSFCTTFNVVAAGGMDGFVHLIVYQQGLGGTVQTTMVKEKIIQHNKYVKAMSWKNSSTAPILATGSADGKVVLTRVKLSFDDDDMPILDVETLKSYHLKGAIEAMTFVNNDDSLIWYERDTPYLTYLNVKNWDICKHSLNGDAPTGGFEDHVSFAVMHLVVSPNGKYLCAATDTSRNIIMQVGTSHIIRNLYGHQNDSYSQPRAAWSKNGKYIFGNAQDDGSTTIMVWDIASSEIVRYIKGIHKGQVRDIFSSPQSDTLVTASYDKLVKVLANTM